MKKLILSFVFLLGVLFVKASNKDIEVEVSSIGLSTPGELHGCLASFMYEGHLMELFVVYEGDRCNTLSQAAALYMDGVLVQMDDASSYAVDFACGMVYCV